MFKKIIVLFSLLLLTSCFWNNKNNENVSITNNVQTWNNLTETQHFNNSISQSENWDLYSVKIDESFKSQENFKNYEDWFALYKKDLSYFQNNRKEELEFFNVWSDYLYGTNYTNWTCNNLSSCVEWKITSDKVWDNFCKMICEWKVWYNEQEWEDFSILKNQFINYKKNLNWQDTEVKTIDDYFIWNIFKWKYSEKTLVEDYFYFTTAISLNKCSELKDKVLVWLCDNYVKKNN